MSSRRGYRAHCLQIGAGGKCAARACEHHYANLVIDGCRQKCLAKLIHHVVVESIQRLGTIHGDDMHKFFSFGFNHRHAEASRQVKRYTQSIRTQLILIVS